MVAHAGQSTPQCVSKSMVVILGYLEWPQIYHRKVRSPIHNCTVYRGMPKISEVPKQRILRLEGNCIRYTDEVAYNFILWKPNNGIRNRYVDRV